MIIKNNQEAMPWEATENKEMLRKHSLKFKGPVEFVRLNGNSSKGILIEFGVSGHTYRCRTLSAHNLGDSDSPIFIRENGKIIIFKALKYEEIRFGEDARFTSDESKMSFRNIFHWYNK